MELIFFYRERQARSLKFKSCCCFCSDVCPFFNFLHYTLVVPLLSRQISHFWTNFTLLDKSHTSGQISHFWTNLTILDKSNTYGQISYFWTNLILEDKSYIFCIKDKTRGQALKSIFSLVYVPIFCIWGLILIYDNGSERVAF